MQRFTWFSLASLGLVLVAGSGVSGQTPKDNAARFREIFIQLDSNGDTVLDRDEIPAAGRVWFEDLLKRGDTNKNGKLEAEEYRALVQKLAVLNDISTVLARFKGMDKDGDGKVTRAEFTGVPANFERIDTDKDGALSKEEITKFFTPRLAAAGAGTPKAKPDAKSKPKVEAEAPAKPKDDAKKEVAKTPTDAEKADLLQRFAFLDKDGDGKISKSEFLREKLFDRLDTDKDGFLSPTELAKFMKPEE